MKTKTKKLLLKLLQAFWIYKLYRWITRDKSRCKLCNKNPADSDYGGLCFLCYFKLLRKTK